MDPQGRVGGISASETLAERCGGGVVVILSFLFSIGWHVGILYLLYRTRENIINDFKGIYYKSTAHYFAFHGGVLVFLFFSVGAGG